MPRADPPSCSPAALRTARTAAKRAATTTARLRDRLAKVEAQRDAANERTLAARVEAAAEREARKAAERNATEAWREAGRLTNQLLTLSKRVRAADAVIAGATPGKGQGRAPKAQTEAQKAMGTEEKSPLAYMLEVMRDKDMPAERRDAMAKAAAPFVHSKLSSVDQITRPAIDLTKLSTEQLEALDEIYRVAGIGQDAAARGGADRAPPEAGPSGAEDPGTRD